MSDGTTQYRVVYVTAPTGSAEGLARQLVERRLAACVNIIPTVRSIYRWQGQICDDEESLLVIKTRAAQLDALQASVVELHPYDVPEVIAMPISGGYPDYLMWLDENTTAREP